MPKRLHLRLRFNESLGRETPEPVRRRRTQTPASIQTRPPVNMARSRPVRRSAGIDAKSSVKEYFSPRFRLSVRQPHVLNTIARVETP